MNLTCWTPTFNSQSKNNLRQWKKTVPVIMQCSICCQYEKFAFRIKLSKENSGSWLKRTYHNGKWVFLPSRHNYKITSIRFQGKKQQQLWNTDPEQPAHLIMMEPSNAQKETMMELYPCQNWPWRLLQPGFGCSSNQNVIGQLPTNVWLFIKRNPRIIGWIDLASQFRRYHR